MQLDIQMRLECEFEWSESAALKFMQVHELSKSVNFTDLDVPVSALYLLAAPSTPEAARDAVLSVVLRCLRLDECK
jgi:hypothetical protein